MDDSVTAPILTDQTDTDTSLEAISSKLKDRIIIDS